MTMLPLDSDLRSPSISVVMLLFSPSPSRFPCVLCLLSKNIPSSCTARGEMKFRMLEVVVVVVVMLGALLPPRVASQGSDCVDRSERCPGLAAGGHCAFRPTYMRTTCAFSCKTCQEGQGRGDSNAPAAPSGSVTSPQAATTTTTTTTTTAAAAAATATTTRKKSIVNPDFECGGARASRTPRRSRQAPANPVQEEEEHDHLFEIGNPPSGFVDNLSCGASVISRRFLLTAASCIDPKNPISSVRLGDLDLVKKGEPNSAPADYNIVKIYPYPHDSKTRGTRYHDIALLETDRDIVFNDAVFPHCISPRVPSPGNPVTVAGYGQYNETHKTTHLLEARLTVLPIDQCENLYLQRNEQRIRKAYPELLKDKGIICAGADNTGVCKGDEGGPLFRRDASGRSFLEGITAFTDSRCSTGLLPGLFTAVAAYVDFIDYTLYGKGNA